MARRQLQIKQLSNSGQLLGCVNCFSGQISVLRAQSHSSIRPYLNALAGIAGNEKFVIEIDHDPFWPQDHNLIGFGERLIANDGTVESFLASRGVPQNLIRSMLVSYGLDHLEAVSCAKISRCEERRLRILGAVYQEEKILIINDPFDPISSEWRERFAELLVNFARNKKQIVLVPYLSYRPECWIDNEFIARIQVGDSIQKTIGFTNDNSEMNEMVKKLRAEHQAALEGSRAAREPDAETSPLKSAPAKRGRSLRTHPDLIAPDATPLNARAFEFSLSPARLWYLENRKKLALGLVAAVSLFTVVSIGSRSISKYRSQGHPDIQSASGELDGRSPATEQSADSPPEMLIIDRTGDNPGDSVVIGQGEESLKVALFMRYPEPIRNAITAGIVIGSGNPEASEASLKPSPEKSEAVKKNKMAADFLKLLETTGSDSGESEPEGSGPNYPLLESMPDSEISGGTGEEQARREQIRQKFLEAIQRAQERADY